MSGAVTGAGSAADRARLIRRVHASARALGLDDATRRALQRRVTGRSSCSEMSAMELARVVAEMGRTGRRDRLPTGAGAAKLRALWISGWHLGVVRDRTDAGLAAWVRRQTGLDAAAWTTPAGLARAVEALKSWLAREAGVDWAPYAVAGGEALENPRARVLEAQWRMLHRLGAVRIGDTGALASYACRHAGIARRDSHTALTPDRADALIRHFGGRIRKARDGDADRARG